MAVRKAKVKANYMSSSLDPMFVLKGEPLVVAYESEEWPGWIWCINNEGKSGWVPLSYVKINDDSAVAGQDYDATELTVRAGDIVDVLGEESGWCWCQYGDDEKGWVPLDNLRLL